MRATLVLPPNREIDFGFGCGCFACVRACERAKLRARDDSSMARARRENLWGPSSSSVVRAEVPIKSSSFRNSDRCILIAMTQ